MFEYKFYESRSNNSLIYGYHPNFTSIYHFFGEKVVKNWYKKLLLAIKGRSPNFKKVFLLFSPMLDTNIMNLGQIAHKLWILSLFFLFTTFGDERVAKK